jgi:hypothetical protein
VNYLNDLFAKNGGSAVVDKMKADAEACMVKYDEYLELDGLFNSIEADFLYYQQTISPDMMALRTTDEQIDRVKTWKDNLVKFKSDYETDTDEEVKKYFKDIYDNYCGNIPVVTSIIPTMENAKVKAEKRRKDQEAYAKLPPQDQITANPAIPANVKTEGYDYEKKGTEPGEENKPNQLLLKGKGLYDKKTGSYNIFQQGKSDTNEVDMNDAVQGLLGDCFLISSIASVARANPGYIKSLISYNKEDTYATVTLHIRNDQGKREAKQIKVDFYFPMKGFTEAFAKKGDNELWVMIIEKAYAKEMGGYDNIAEGGNAGEALAVLTGNESVYNKIDDEDEALGAALENAVKADTAAVAGTKSHNEIHGYTPEKINAAGATEGYKVVLADGTEIFCEHAYSILEVDKTAKKVKLRNPHGGDNAVISIKFDEFRACFSGFNVSQVPKDNKTDK